MQKVTQNLKRDFPILQNNKEIVYLDTTATAQKPSFVINGIKDYLENDYSNIHRGVYDIAEKSEQMYIESKKKIASFLNVNNWREIIYSFNSTYASNLLVGSLKRSKFFKKGDKVLLSIVEHHANIVPWLILKEEVGIEIEYIKIKNDFSLDFEDLKTKLDDKVKAISITYVSNVTGEIFDLERVGEVLQKKYKKENKPIFIVDASQSFPHFKIDVKKLGCDALFLTGHKFMADSGIGILWGKEELLKNLEPVFSGGGAILSVAQSCFKPAGLPDRFEPGTPNLSGAISILKALEYIENIGGYEFIKKKEKELVSYTLTKFKEFKEIKIIGSKKTDSRIGVFSFIIPGIHSHDIAEYLADNDICIRAGQHCAEPFMGELGVNHTCRMSLYIYNTFSDIDKFFNVLKKTIKELS